MTRQSHGSTQSITKPSAWRTSVGRRLSRAPGSPLDADLSRWDRNRGRQCRHGSAQRLAAGAHPRHQDTCLIHGDFRCDNMLLIHMSPRSWRCSTGIVDARRSARRFRLSRDGLSFCRPNSLPDCSDRFGRPQHPDEADHIATYCRRTGRSDIPDYSFYLAFQHVPASVDMHGIRQRALAAMRPRSRGRVGALYEPLPPMGGRRRRELSHWKAVSKRTGSTIRGNRQTFRRGGGAARHSPGDKVYRHGISRMYIWTATGDESVSSRPNSGMRRKTCRLNGDSPFPAGRTGDLPIFLPS